MKRDRSLAEAVAGRLAGRRAAQPLADVPVLETLLLDRNALDEAWGSLGSPRSRRHAGIQVGDVLELVVWSAVLTGLHDEGRDLLEETKARFEGLTEAASRLLAFFLARSGQSQEALEGPRWWSPPGGGAPTEELAAARHLAWILEYLSVEGLYERSVIYGLPRPRKARGPNAAARMFEHRLTAFLERTYGQPSHAFVLALSRILYPRDEWVAESDGTALSRGRGKEERQREAERRRVAEEAAELDGNHPEAWAACADPDVTWAFRCAEPDDPMVAEVMRDARAAEARFRKVEDIASLFRKRRVARLGR